MVGAIWRIWNRTLEKEAFEKADDNRQEARQGFEILSLNEDVIWSCGVKEPESSENVFDFPKSDW